MCVGRKGEGWLTQVSEREEKVKREWKKESRRRILLTAGIQGTRLTHFLQPTQNVPHTLPTQKVPCKK